MSSIPLVALAGQQYQPKSQLARLLESTQQQGLAQAQQQQAALAPGVIQAQANANTESQQRVQMNDQEMAARKAAQDAYSQSLGVDESGAPTINRTKLENALAQSGHGDQIPAIVQGFNSMDENAAKLSSAKVAAAEAENNYMGAGAGSVIASNYDPNVINTVLQHATQAGYGQHVQQLQQELAQNPNKAPQIFQAIRDQSTKQQELANNKKQPTEASLAAGAAGGNSQDQDALNLLVKNQGGVEGKELADFIANPPKGYKGTPIEFARYKATLSPTATFNLNGGAGGGLTDTALDQAADRYWETGVLPSMGMGAAGAAARKNIMNRAGERHPDGQLAPNSAEFAANKQSLTNLQKNFDQVSAFENTAGKNLDQFLTTAKSVVDSGSPLLNTPVRLVSDKLAGSANQAAFNAARTTALTEISKVLNSSNASGVLSDSARNEVSQLIGPNATLAQIYSAAKILKTDMGNRHDAYQDQINVIKGRLGGGGSSTPSQPTSSGKTLTQAQIQQAAKDHNVSVDEATKQAKAAGYTVQ